MMLPRLSPLVLGYVWHNIITPFAHRPQVCDGRGPLLVSFQFVFSFSHSLLTVFPLRVLFIWMRRPPLSLVNVPFFRIDSCQVWLGFGSFYGSFFLVPPCSPPFSPLIPILPLPRPVFLTLLPSLAMKRASVGFPLPHSPSPFTSMPSWAVFLFFRVICADGFPPTFKQAQQCSPWPVFLRWLQLQMLRHQSLSSTSFYVVLKCTFF